MADEKNDLSRREFVAMSVAAGLAAAAGRSCPAPSCRSKSQCLGENAGRHVRRGVHPSGERLASRRADLARRVRSASRPCATSASGSPPTDIRCSCRIPTIAWPRRPASDTSSFSFQNPADMAKLQPLMGSDQRARRGGKGRGGLHRLPRRAAAGEHGEEDRHAGLLHGRTARDEDGAAVPDRVGAGASFHGGGLVTDRRTARTCSPRR